MNITKQENSFGNLKELFWEANEAFIKNNRVLLKEDYLNAACAEH